jgi:hypothetical protein
MDHYIQQLQIKDPGLYYLQVKYLPATYMPIGKDFGIKINNTQIANIEITDGTMIDRTF